MRMAAYSSLVLAVSGFLFCLITLANGGTINCTGGGCSLYADMELMGLSFYAWGTVLFAVLLFAWGKSWFYSASMLALAADVPFLVWQGFMTPCSSCLTVSVLLTLIACSARAPARAFGPVKGGAARRLVIFAAIVLIACGFFNLVKETTAPWSITARGDTSRFLFFSPSCEPCRRHIEQKLVAGTLAQVSLVPIALSRNDYPAIRAMASAYAEEGQAGLLAVLSGELLPGASAPSIFENLELTLKLHWNYGHLVRSGGTGVPWYSGVFEESREKGIPEQAHSPATLDTGCGITGAWCSSTDEGTDGGIAW